MKKFFSALFRHIFDFITLLVFSVVIVPPFLALNAPAWLLAAATLLYPLAFNYLPTMTTIADIILWIVGLVWVICGKTLVRGIIGPAFPIIYYVLFALFFLYLLSAACSAKRKRPAAQRDDAQRGNNMAQTDRLQDESELCEASAKTEQDMQTYNSCVHAIERATGFIATSVVTLASHTERGHAELCDLILPFFALGALESEYISPWAQYAVIHSDQDALIDDLNLWVANYVYKLAALYGMEDSFDAIVSKGNMYRIYVSGFLKKHADDSIRLVCYELFDALSISRLYLSEEDVDSVADAVDEAFGRIMYLTMKDCLREKD